MLRVALTALCMVTLMTSAAGYAAVEAINGGTDGYCVITRDGSGDVHQPDDYVFYGPTGQITLKTIGTWVLTYQSVRPGEGQPAPVDVRRIEQDVSDPGGDLIIRADGANLAAPIYFPSTAFTGAKTIKLNLTGSFPSGAGIDAPDFTLTDCVIAGDVPAASSGITAFTVTDTSGVGLQIGGEGADYVKLAGNADLVPSPGVHVQREYRACGPDLHATC
jgi:hypothetical protein